MLKGAKTVKFFDADFKVMFEAEMLGGSNGYFHITYGGKEYVIYVQNNKIHLKPTQDRLPNEE